jgi:hypothetical protein
VERFHGISPNDALSLTQAAAFSKGEKRPMIIPHGGSASPANGTLARPVRETYHPRS